LIAVDPAGNFAMPFSSAGMVHGTARDDQLPKAAVFEPAH
jgi:hypothetical protein